MASRFWVGGGSTNAWAATANTNWAASSGGANNASVPTTTDVAIFDSNSGVGTASINASITIQSLECDGSSLGTGAYAGTIAHPSGATLTLNTGQANTLRFSAGMTYSPTAISSVIALTHTSGTANIKSYGKSLAALTINGAGGTTQTLDELTINAVQNSVLTLNSGIFDFKGGAGGPFALTACLVNITGATTRSFIMGGTLTLGGNAASGQTIFNSSTSTGLTFTKNSANIVILAPAGNIENWAFSTGLTLNGVTLNATTNSAGINWSISNTVSFLTVNSGWVILLAANITASAASGFNFTGTAISPIILYNTIIGAVPTLTCTSGACVAIWTTIFTVTAAGGATFNATNSFNGGNTSGWSISPPADASSAGIASAVWKDLLAGGDFGTAGSVGALFTSGGVAIQSNKKKDVLSNGFMFVMTSSTTNQPQTGLTVTSQVSLDGGAFGSTVNAVTELSNGVYVLNIAAADVNGNHAMFRFTATGANVFFAEVITQP